MQSLVQCLKTLLVPIFQDFCPFMKFPTTINNPKNDYIYEIYQIFNI